MQVSEDNAHLLKGIMDQTYEKTKGCLETNFYGTKRVTEALLPLLHLSKSARIVNMSSLYGLLKVIKEMGQTIYRYLNFETNASVMIIISSCFRIPAMKRPKQNLRISTA